MGWSRKWNNLFERFLRINNIEMYSAYNEGKSVVAERFIRTLENKIFKDMTTVSKNVYFDVLDDIVNKYNNAVHRSIKMKPIDVTAGSYAEYDIFAKGYTPNWSEEAFAASKIKNAVPWAYVINGLNGEPITGSFYKKELQKPSQEKFRIEKVLKRKGDKMYVKWKGYDNSFNSWIDKKDLEKSFFKWNSLITNESILS